MFLPGWNDPRYRSFVPPAVIFMIASAASFIGSYYAGHCDEKEHRLCGVWCVVLLMLGIVFVLLAWGPF
jgi:hypothetical protein